MAIQKFNFQDHEVRVIQGEDSEPRWVAIDVSRILGFSEASAMTRHLDDDEKGLSNWQTPGGSQQMITITESGLYSAVLRSRKPEAKIFKKWVTSEVLPSIRKTGGYQVAEISDDELMARAVLAANTKIKSLEMDNLAQAAQLEAAAPKVAYHDEFVADTDLIQFRTLAAQLQIGEKELRETLRIHGWIYRLDYERWSNKKNCKVMEYQWRAKAEYKKYFQLVPNHSVPRLAGEVRQTLKIRPSGATAIAKAVQKWSAGKQEELFESPMKGKKNES